MALLILLVCFIAIFLSTAVWLPATMGKKDVLISSVLIFSFFIVLVTEVLSALQLITFGGLLAAWGSIALITIAYLYYKKTMAIAFLASLKQRIAYFYASLNGFERFFFYAVLVMLALVFVQGIIYPPNNWDSMTYHMARIPNWISHRSLEPYPTHIVRQIYQPPFAEYAIMNIDLLNGNDVLSASIQFIFWLFSLAAIAAIAKALGLNRNYQLAAIFLGATVPEVILQASSTQNDIVAGFFMLSAYYFSIRAINNTGFKYYLFLGLSVGLSLLTKGTGYIYLAPILLFFGAMLIIRLFQTKNFKSMGYALAAVIIALGLNAPRLARNYKVSHNIWGADDKEMRGYSNESMSPALFISAAAKNIGLQTGVFGTNRVAVFADSVVYKFDALLNVNTNDPKTNYNRAVYSTPINVANHEDYAPNLLHLLLIFTSCIIICVYYFKKQRNAGICVLFVILLLQCVLFCGYLKWQPWNTRLQVPLFMLAIPLVCYAISINKRFRKVVYFAVFPLLLIYGITISLRNESRPFISKGSNPLFNTRYQNYFADIPDHYPEYNAIVKAVQHAGYQNIGLLTGGDTYEYPLFVNCYSTTLNPVSIQVTNYTQTLPAGDKIDCIISTTVNTPLIDYQGKRFSKSDSNKYIHLYTPVLSL